VQPRDARDLCARAEFAGYAGAVEGACAFQGDECGGRVGAVGVFDGFLLFAEGLAGGGHCVGGVNGGLVAVWMGVLWGVVRTVLMYIDI
jgi:hypothetical protein